MLHLPVYPLSPFFSGVVEEAVICEEAGAGLWEEAGLGLWDGAVRLFLAGVTNPSAAAGR